MNNPMVETERAGFLTTHPEGWVRWKELEGKGSTCVSRKLGRVSMGFKIAGVAM